MLGIHHIPSEALLTRSPFPAFEAVWTHCLARTSGALQPATSRAMRMQATRLFHSTLLVKINLLIILIIVVVIVVVVIVCVINENSFDPCDGSTWSRKSKSVTKCNFCFKPVQLYGSRW